MTEINIKRGDTLYLVCTYTDNSDVPVDLTSVGIESKVMTSTKIHYLDLVVTKLDQITNKGKFTITKNPTDVLEVGKYFWDIQYTESGLVQSTETMVLNVLEDVV